MMTMSDDGDRTCPLCAEEMDITDQQLKPCKCGYEICVWCWHHIIDMAEKEDTEGRCPACRTRYDKDRIVKMAAATCDRTVADKNTDKKQKTQKVKSKALTVEAKKHLASVRVIQRNLVYIIGLPANLCNESVLERREYFGQYGKVLKVSVSRPTGTPSQQTAPNNGISVYITYAKEEEAIRCIQAVHNFVLEGKVLRACFGTTKYCHAWLRNMTCGNPDCLYLHDVGSQEDSFTKDEIISAYTRSRVPQMASTVSQRRAGTVLPPPADDFSYSAVVSAKHTIKNGTTNTTSQSRLSPPNSSSGRSTLPPATSWGHRDLNTRTTATEVASSQSVVKSKSEAQSNSFSSSSMISSARLPSSWNDDTSIVPKMAEGRQLSERDSLSKTSKPYRPGIAKETQAVTSLESSLDIDFSTIPSAWNDDEVVASDVPSKGSEVKQVVNGQLVPSTSSKPTEPGQLVSKSSSTINNGAAVNSSKQSLIHCMSRSAISNPDVKSGNGDHMFTNMGSKSPTLRAMNSQSNHTASDDRPGDREVDKLSVGVSSLNLDGKDKVHSMEESQQLGTVLNTSVPLSQSLNKEQSQLKFAGLLSSENKDSVLYSQSMSDKHLDWSSELQSSRATSPLNDIWNSSVATDKSHVRMLDTTDQTLSSSYVHTANTSLWNDKEVNRTSTSDNRTSGTMMHTGLLASIDNNSTLLNGRQEGPGPMCTPAMVSEHSGMRSQQHGALDAARNDNIGGFGKAISGNKDEGSIISDILSMEFDPWDESYSTANNFVKMLNESEKNDALFNTPSWKSKGSSNESRFSFARQDNQRNFQDSSFRNSGSDQNFSLLSQNNAYQNGAVFQSSEEDFSKSNPLAMSDIATAGSSRSKISAPPGFSAPARVPPPGFSSQDGLNPPPGFSSGFSSQDMLNSPHGFPSGFSSQAGSNPPHGFSSQTGSNPPHGFSSQAGSNPPRGFNSGFSSQDGSNIPPGFSAGFSSQNGSNQKLVYLIIFLVATPISINHRYLDTQVTSNLLILLYWLWAKGGCQELVIQGWI
ncbi:unnamed protein product [Alopecurus aequalis]